MKKGKGGSGGGGDINRLMEKGFSKTKATKAWKDAGGDFRVALRILEAQREAAEPKVPTVTAAAAAPAHVEVTRPKPSLLEEEEQKKRIKKHPCIVQYKSCRYGENCFFKDLPGDVCIEYARGFCIHGSFCKRKHVVDGVDIREEYRSQESGLVRGSGGEEYEVVEEIGGKTLRVARRVEKEKREGEEEDLFDFPLPPPDPSAFNVIQGTEPTYIDPYNDDDEANYYYTAATSEAPKPFLETLLKASDGVSPAGPARVATAPTEPVARPFRKRHPCIHQLGSCKYEVCNFSDRDADVCVYFLQGKCRNTAETCRYRHETEEEYSAKLWAEQVGKTTTTTAMTAHSAEDSSKKHTRTAKPPREDGVGSPSESASEEDENGSEEEEGEANDLVPTSAEAEVLLQSAGAAAEEEFTLLLNLLNIYPDEDPAFVLLALRSAGGDPAVAADLLSKVNTVDVAEDDAELARVLQEEQDASDGHGLQEVPNRNSGSDSNALLTLCTLFPTVEPAVIEGVLRTNCGDFSDAYSTLLCSVENLERSKMKGMWKEGELRADEKLRLQKLVAMFPDVDPTVVRNAYLAAEKNVSTTITVLNELVTESITWDARQKMGEEAIRWRPAPPKRKKNTAVPQNLPQRLEPVEEHGYATSEEAAAMYREMESEAREYGDWRRTRERAYLVNTCRIRLLSQASAAFLKGDKRTASILSKEGKQLGAEYYRLNRLAMLALERERLAGSTSTLDLHGFHASEAVEVVSRRVELCKKKNIGRLTVVMGEGRHSKKGRPSVYPEVLEHVQTDPYLASNTEVLALKPAYMELRILL